MSIVLATSQVSVWNASYQPLGATTLARAIALVNSGRAVIEEIDESRILRFATGEFLFPKIIRLLSFVNVPFQVKEEYWSRSGVLRRDKHTCAWCGKSSKDGVLITVDHLVAQSLGGKDTWENTVACCQPCNSKKANKSLEAWGKTLLFEPTIPKRVYYISEKKKRKKNK